MGWNSLRKKFLGWNDCPLSKAQPNIGNGGNTKLRCRNPGAGARPPPKPKFPTTAPPPSPSPAVAAPPPGTSHLRGALFCKSCFTHGSHHQEGQEGQIQEDQGTIQDIIISGVLIDACSFSRFSMFFVSHA